MDLVPTAVSPEAIDATYERLRPHIRRTPVVTVDRADFGLAPGPLVLKLEFLQHSGSFKARGAFANLLMRDIPPTGVVAASGGNHGAAVAYAARALGVSARIYVPTVSSPAKIDRIRGYGAELVVTGDAYAEAYAASERWRRDSSALPVHAFDQDETMLGTGTLATELLAQAPEATVVLAAVGGGGLLAGIAARYAGAVTVVGGRAGGRAHAARRPARRPAGGRAGRQRRGGLAGAAADRRAELPGAGQARRPGGAGRRRRDPRRAAAGCGRRCGSWRSRAAAPRSPRCSPAPTGRGRATCRSWWSAAPTPAR